MMLMDPLLIRGPLMPVAERYEAGSIRRSDAWIGLQTIKSPVLEIPAMPVISKGGTSSHFPT